MISKSEEENSLTRQLSKVFDLALPIYSQSTACDKRNARYRPWHRMECLDCSSIPTPTRTVSGGGRFQEDLHFGERFFRIVGKKCADREEMSLLGSCWNPLARMHASGKKSLGAASRVVSNVNLDVSGFG